MGAYTVSVHSISTGQSATSSAVDSRRALFSNGYARHVGRVGALAVVLGIGAAVALPGVSYAETGTADPAANTANESQSGAPGPNDAPSGPKDEVNQGEDKAEQGISEDGSVGGFTDQLDADTSPLDPPAGLGDGEQLDPPSTPEPPVAEPPIGDNPTTPIDPPAEGNDTAQPTSGGGEERGNGAPTTHVPEADSELKADALGGAAVYRSTAQSLTADDEAAFVTSNLVQGNGITTLAVAPPQPQPNLVDTLLAIPGTLVSGVLDVVSDLLAPIIGPGGILNSPFLWGALLAVRRQFDQAFANSTPVLQPIQTSQDIDDGQVHGTFGGSDVDGDTLTYSVPARGAVGGPAHGTVTINQVAGTWAYTPDDNGTPTNYVDDYRGPDSFTVTSSDAGSGFHIHAFGATHAAVASVEVQVGSSQADPPIVPDPRNPYTPTPLQPGDPVGTVRGTVNAADPNGLAITYSNAGPGTTADGSTIEVNPNGAFVYTPSDDARHASSGGADKFTFTATATNSGGAAIDIAVTVPVGPAINEDPRSIEPVVNAPISGVVRGTVIAVDDDEDVLRYAVLSHPSSGGVEIDSLTGEFTYSASAEARSAAAATPGLDTASFTVVITDGHGGQATVDVSVGISPTGVIGEVTQQVTAEVFVSSVTYAPGGGKAIVAYYSSGATSYVLIDTATGGAIGDPIIVPGVVNTALGGQLAPEFSADGSRVVVYTWKPPTYGSGEIFTTYAAIIDATSWTQLGSTIHQTGAGRANFGAEYSRVAVITGIDTIYGSDAAPTQVSVYDAATGAQIGNRVVVFESRYSRSTVNADGTSAVFVLSEYTGVTEGNLAGRTSSVVLVDLVNGTQIGHKAQLTGHVDTDARYGVADARVVLTTSSLLDYDADLWTTRIVVFDTATGDVVGATTTIAGDAVGVSIIGDARALVTTSDGRSSGLEATYVTLIDLVDGTPLRDSVVISGGTYSGAEITLDGTRAVVVTGRYQADSRLVVIDTGTGAQVGETIVQAGRGSDSPQLALDGSRAILVTNGEDSSGSTMGHVSVVDVASGVRVGGIFNHNGSVLYQVTADGTKTAVLFRADDYQQTSVLIIDNATGSQVGQMVTAPGDGYYLQLIRDESFGLLVSEGNSTSVTIVDMATGEQVGETVTRAGYGYVWSTDDGYATENEQVYGMLIISTTTDSGEVTSTITVVDINAGQSLGGDISVQGRINYRIFSDDSTRAFIYSEIIDPETRETSIRFNLIDLTAGTRLGEPIAPTGYHESWRFVGSDRAVLFAHNYDDVTLQSETQVTIFNADTGTPIGDTLYVTGNPEEVLYLEGDRYAVLATSNYDDATERTTTRLAVVDMVDGKVVGDVLVQKGAPVRYIFGSSSPALSADRTHAIFATGDYDSATGSGAVTITTTQLPGSELH